MAKDFSAGDEVELKSGGPAMTVEEVDADRGARCTWFDKKTNQRFEDWFALATLKSYKKPTVRFVTIGRA